MTFAWLLHERMRAQRVSRAELLAMLTQIDSRLARSHSALSRWLCSETVPAPEVIQGLCVALDVPPGSQVLWHTAGKVRP